MKKNSVILLLAAAVLASVVAWLMQSGSKQKTGSAAETLPGIPSFDLAKVAEVRIRDASGSATLALGAGSWGVRERGGFAAEVGKLASLLKGLAELKPVQSVDVPPSHLDRLGLVDPQHESPKPSDAMDPVGDPGGQKTGTRVTVLDASGKPLADWIVGKVYYPEAGAPPGGMQSGRYYRTPDSNTAFLAGDVARGLTASPADWLEKSLLLPDLQISRIEVKPEGGDEAAWTAAVGEGEHAALQLQGLKKGESPKPGVLPAIEGQLLRLRFDDVQVAAANEGGGEAADFRAVASVRITSRDGSVFDLAFGSETDGLTPLKITKTPGDKSDGSPDAGSTQTDGTIYLVRTFALGQLLSPKSDLLQPPPTPVPSPAPEGNSVGEGSAE